MHQVENDGRLGGDARRREQEEELPKEDARLEDETAQGSIEGGVAAHSGQAGGGEGEEQDEAAAAAYPNRS
jgi:hypothetical protein